MSQKIKFTGLARFALFLELKQTQNFHFFMQN